MTLLKSVYTISFEILTSIVLYSIGVLSLKVFWKLFIYFSFCFAWTRFYYIKKKKCSVWRFFVLLRFANKVNAFSVTRERERERQREVLTFSSSSFFFSKKNVFFGITITWKLSVTLSSHARNEVFFFFPESLYEIQMRETISKSRTVRCADPQNFSRQIEFSLRRTV